jgi:hypothetical protein
LPCLAGVLAAFAHQSTDRVPRLLYKEAIGYTRPIERLLREQCSPQSPRDYFDMDITRVTFQPTRLTGRVVKVEDYGATICSRFPF